MNNRLLTRTVLSATAIGVLLVPACSSDDDEPSATDDTEAVDTDTTATTTTHSADTTAPAATGDEAAFCDAVVETDVQFAAMQGPDGDPAAVTASLEAVESSAPDELADQTAFVIEEANAMLAGAGAEEGPSEEFNANYGEMVAWMANNCGFPVVNVTAEDYAFEGIPETVAAGETLISFTNTGDEAHELLLLHKNEGVTETFDEILALGEEEGQALVTQAAGTFAMPGGEGWTTSRLESGEYVAICFVPVGMTPEAMEAAETGGAEPEGPPHFTEGMIREFTVE